MMIKVRTVLAGGVSAAPSSAVLPSAAPASDSAAGVTIRVVVTMDDTLVVCGVVTGDDTLVVTGDDTLVVTRDNTLVVTGRKGLSLRGTIRSWSPGTARSP